MNISINNVSHIEIDYLKSHQNNCSECKINTTNANRNLRECNCTSILSVQKIKYLVTYYTINSNLKWQHYIKNITSRIKLLFYTFKTLRNILSHPTMGMVFIAMAWSILWYWDLGWSLQATVHSLIYLKLL